MNDAPMQITPLIQLTGVTKEYASPGEPVRVLTGVDLTVERGARVAIVGPSDPERALCSISLGPSTPPTTARYR